MDQVEINDLNVCYEFKGGGYPLVLILGLTAHMEWWDPELVDDLRKRFRVLTFDNRGAGRTVTPEVGEFSVEMFADDTAALMDALGIEGANVLGLSMGGMIAQKLVLKYPEKVTKLVLCSTHCGGEHRVPPSEKVLQVMADRSGGLDGIFERSLHLTFPNDYLDANQGFIERFKERFMMAPCSDANAMRQFKAILDYSTYDYLPEIKIPTLVATGTEDIMVPPENSRIIAERIPGAKLIEYEGAGHHFMWQLRDILLEDLLEFLG